MYTLVPPSYRYFISTLALIGQAVSEKIFEYYDKMRYCHGVGADQNHKSSVHLPIAFKFLPSNDILAIVPIQMNGRPMLTCRKIGQGHPRVMIYINFVELLFLILHAKFQNHWPSGSGVEDFLKVFVIYSHGGHIGLVTLTIYINFRSPFLRMLHMKVKQFQNRRSLKLWTTTDDDDGRTPDHGYPISSPCEPSAQVSQNISHTVSHLGRGPGTVPLNYE